MRAALILLFLLAAAPAQAVSMGRCTPPVLRAFVAKWGATVISAHRRGARVAGTRRLSLHAHCNGRSGAVDVRPRRGTHRALASEARRRGFGVGTYSGRMSHIHLSVGGKEGSFHKHYGRRRR